MSEIDNETIKFDFEAHRKKASQYPTVNALLGNWDVLKASSVRFEDCTSDAKQLLSKVALNSTFDRKLWKKSPFSL